MTASPNSSPNDFDFLIGKWKMHNRHLDKRLANCRDLDGVRFLGCEYKDSKRCGRHGHILDLSVSRNGRQTFRRSYLAIIRPKTRLWSLYWIASNTGTIDLPVVGSFDQNGVGHFFGKDTLNGKPILVVFRWDARNKDRPVWGQAFSPDNGKTWEWNFFNVSERPKE